MIQLIAMDMDGTLLTPPPVHISAPTLDVLRAASDRGIHLALASGRLPEDAGSFAAQASLDMAVIALNGSCMALHPLHSLVHLHHLQNETATILMKRFLHLGLTFGLFSGEDLYIHDEDPTHPSPAMMWGTYLPQRGGRMEASIKRRQ